jgi:hypothetical protein
MRSRSTKRAQFSVETLEGRAAPSAITITSVTLNQRTGTVTVTGTAPPDTTVGVQVNETVGRFNTVAGNDAPHGTPVDDQGNFTVTLSPFVGKRFQSGSASVDVFDFTTPDSASETVSLKPSH